MTPGDHPLQPRGLILASTSPRRRELLSQAGYSFEIVPPPFDEPEDRQHVHAAAFAESLAFFKATSVSEARPNAVVLGADTVASTGDEIIGKPADRADARRILRTLSGTTHDVITGLALVRMRDVRRMIRHAVSTVRVRPLSDEMIEAYLDTGLWRGKAGAYGIQDRNDPFVEATSGSYSNIMGLPLELLAEMFGEWVSQSA